MGSLQHRQSVLRLRIHSCKRLRLLAGQYSTRSHSRSAERHRLHHLVLRAPRTTHRFQLEQPEVAVQTRAGLGLLHGLRSMQRTGKHSGEDQKKTGIRTRRSSLVWNDTGMPTSLEGPVQTAMELQLPNHRTQSGSCLVGNTLLRDHSQDAGAAPERPNGQGLRRQARQREWHLHRCSNRVASGHMSS